MNFNALPEAVHFSSLVQCWENLGVHFSSLVEFSFQVFPTQCVRTSAVFLSAGYNKACLTIRGVFSLICCYFLALLLWGLWPMTETTCALPVNPAICSSHPEGYLWGLRTPCDAFTEPGCVLRPAKAVSGSILAAGAGHLSCARPFTRRGANPAHLSRAPEATQPEAPETTSEPIPRPPLLRHP
jgi:hypothetical protein